MNAIGQSLSRADGRLKVTGGARYTADIPVAGAAHAAIVYSTIANGRTVAIDTAAAERAPGVVAIFTYRNMPRMNPTPKPWSHLRPHGQSYLPLQDDRIHYAGQPIALVVADTLAQASRAGTLIEVRYEVGKPRVFGRNVVDEALDPPQFLWPVNSSVGDARKALAAAAVKIEQTYTTADRHHNQMEPHATTAVWEADGTLTLYDATQHIFGTKELVAIVLGIPPEKINVVSQFVGGGFDAPFSGAAAEDVVVANGALALAGKNLNITYAELLTRNELSSLAGDGDYDPVEEAMGPKAIFSFGAVFTEARVDPDFGTVRVNRVVGAYDAGRIINPKTARSQAIGGIIWGVGQALLEQSETDPTTGRFINRNYWLSRADQRRHPRARRVVRRRVRRGGEPARRQRPR
jgi:CO/xanthine dehydrogenase Mo-binding subunit